MRTSADWNSPEIDWTRTNWELALVLGCSTTRIQQKRRQLGKPTAAAEGKSWKAQRKYRMYAKL